MQFAIDYQTVGINGQVYQADHGYAIAVCVVHIRYGCLVCYDDAFCSIVVGNRIASENELMVVQRQVFASRVDVYDKGIVACVVGLDNILAPVACEIVGCVACAANECIVASISIDKIRSILQFDSIVVHSTIECVVSAFGDQIVCAFFSVYSIASSICVDGIAS